MTRRNIKELEKIEPRESKYSIDELIDLCSRKNIDDNNDVSKDLIEVSLCFANEIKKLQIDNAFLKGCIQSGLKPDEAKGAYLALEQMMAKGKITTEEKRRQK